MNYLLKEKITYRTDLPADEVLDRVNSIAEPVRMIRTVFGKRNKDYEGHVIDNKFYISRIIRYKNSLLPKIQGEVISNANGSTINIKMEPVIPGIIILILFACIFSYMVYNSVWPVLNGAANTTLQLPLLIVLLLLYPIIIAVYNYEASIAKRDLKHLFEARIIST
jgi:hypothetical protein